MPQILTDTDGFPSPRIDPVTITEVRRGNFDAATLHPGQYDVKMVSFADNKSRNNAGQIHFSVDLDDHTWISSQGRELQRETGAVASPGCLGISEMMRHPIWDTPDECKTHFLSLITK